MVSQTHLKNRIDFMETYKLLEFSGSDSDNDIVHFASFEQSNPVSHPRKKRLKRKERDLLRASGSIQPENQSRCTTCSPFFGDIPKNICCCDRLLVGRQPSLSRWEFFRSCLLVAIIICLALVTGLAVNLHSRLDATQNIVAKFEASGSELPAKFHESHVRLQQLEKNHTSLWGAFTSVSTDVKDLTEKMKTLEASVKALEDRLSGAPKLSSLPKTVADVEASVATFGSSLQDVQSTLKTLKERQDSLQKGLETTRTSLSSIKSDVTQLKNDTHLPPSPGREGRSDIGGEEPVATAVISLRSDVADLSSTLETINASLTSSLKQRQSGADKVQNIEAALNESILSLSNKVANLQETCDKFDDENWQQHVANLSVDFSHLRDLIDEHSTKIRNINESIAVVKGVEKKLEGSQLQMASGVSELKQQLQKLENSFESLLASTTTASSIQSKHRKRRAARNLWEDKAVIRPSKILET